MIAAGASMDAGLPPGWPADVPPPGAPDWERRAVAFLWDCCPPEFRSYRTLTRHPLALAVFAERCIDGQLRAAQDGVAAVRVDLADWLEPQVVAEAVGIWQAEDARLARAGRAVRLLRRAMQGERFVPRMGYRGR